MNSNRRIGNYNYLKAYFPLNNHTDDVSGNENPSGVVTGATYAISPFGNTFASFDGTNDVILFSSLNTSFSGDFTICGWMFSTDMSAGAYNCILNLAQATSTGLNIGISSTTRKLQLDNSGGPTSTITSVPVIADGVPHHFAVVRIGTTYYLYLDGVLQGTTGGTAPTYTRLFVGESSAGVQDLNGKVGGIRIYNIALTGDEILCIYNSPFQKIISVQEPMNELPEINTSLKMAYLNNKTIGTAQDYSESYNAATATAVGWAPVGGRFNGTTSTIGAGASNVSDSDGTVAVTVSTTDLAQAGTFIFNKVATGTNRYYIRILNQALEVYRNGLANIVTLTSSVAADRKYRVVMTWSNGVLRGYLDGQFIGSIAFTPAGTSDGNSNIGSTGAASFFSGTIEDFELYNVAKDSTWVSTDFAKRVPDSSLILHLINGDTDLSRFKRALVNTSTNIGYPMTFNGTSSTIAFGTGIVAAAAGTAIITFKLNVKDGTNRTLVDFGGSGSSGFLIFSNSSSDVLSINYGNGSSLSTLTTSINTNQVYQVAVTWSGSNIFYYLNGVLQNSATNAVLTTVATTVQRIGNQSSQTRFHSGNIYEVKLFDEKKSVSYIENYYLKTRGYY